MAYNESAMKATVKYVKDKQQRLEVKYKKEEYDRSIKPEIERSGLPVATYIKQAIEEKMLCDNMHIDDIPSEDTVCNKNAGLVVFSDQILLNKIKEERYEKEALAYIKGFVKHRTGEEDFVKAWETFVRKE